MNKQDIVNLVNWALRCYSPLGYQVLKEVNAKWLPVGYELHFDGGSAVKAHFDGRAPGVSRVMNKMTTAATCCSMPSSTAPP